MVKQKIKVEKKEKKLVVISSACPVGIAHTYMAGEALKKVAEKSGYRARVEFHSASGLEEELTAKEIKEAEFVILSLGKAINEKPFYNKKIYYTTPTKAVKEPEQVFVNAKANAKINSKIQKNENVDYSENNNSDDKKRTKLSDLGKVLSGSLLNGVSWMIPIVVAGGILFAIAAGLGPAISPKDFMVNGHINPSQPHAGTFWKALNTLGGAGLTLMIAILGGFIAVGIADKIAFAPAFILSWTSNLGDSSGKNQTFFNYQHMNFGLTHGQLGFLGAILIGFMVGYICKYIKKIKWKSWLKPIVPIIIVPVFVTFFVWLALAFILALPITYITQGLTNGISYLSNHKLFWIAAPIIGFLVAVDMGGPLNKVAFTFAAGLIASPSTFALGALVMGSVAAAIGVPPIGMSLASFFGLKLKIMDKTDFDVAKGSILLGLMGITEGAIPYAVKYPKSAIISNCVGGIVAAGIAGWFQVTDAAAHGSFIVYLVGAVGHKGNTNYVYGLLYVAAIAIGSFVCGALMLFLTRFFYKNVDRSRQKVVSII